MRYVIKMGLIGLLLMTVTTISNADQLLVGCDTDIKPFVYKDADGKITGFEIELWEAIAKELGVSYRLVPMKFTQLLPALAAQKIDMAIAGITIRSDREKQADFSFPYFESGLQISVRAEENKIIDIGDLVDKTVATKEGTTSADFAKNIQTKTVVMYTNIEDAYGALLSKKVDAVIFDSPSTLSYIAKEGKGTIKTVGPTYQRQFYGMAFPQGSLFKEKFDIALLKYMEDGWYDIIFRKWFGYVPQ